MSRYKDLGVDVTKRGIERFKLAIKNLYPNAFCVIQEDPDFSDMGLILHTDSAGSKPVQAYLHYKESGDPKWFQGIAQDALAMNINDIVCVGAKPVSFVDYVAFNTLLLERSEVLGSLSEGFANSIVVLGDEGINILFAGGETADLPDQMRTLDVCVTIYGRVSLKELITGEMISPDDVIIGLRSGGLIRYEDGINSGIMSNGLTLARNVLMKSSYLEKYPELAHPGIDRYRGRFSYDSYLDELDMTVGEALLSPTRFYAPLVLEIIEKEGNNVHGLVHNTGGGLTKSLRLGKRIHYILDDLIEPDPIFKLIQREGNISWCEMYQDFNMGIGCNILVDSASEDSVISIAEKYGIGVKIIGRCEKATNENILTIKTEKGKFIYN